MVMIARTLVALDHLGGTLYGRDTDVREAARVTRCPKSITAVPCKRKI